MLRTIATLQDNLTKDPTRQVLGTLTAIAKGTATENELPQKITPYARKKPLTSGYRGVAASGPWPLLSGPRHRGQAATAP